MKNISKLFTFLFIFFLQIGNCYAQLTAYPIDSKFEAPFPGVPGLEGELGEGEHKIRSYSYLDEENTIIYTATYQVGTTYYKENEISEAIKQYIQGQILSVGGKVVSKTYREINGKTGAVYTMEYNYNEMAIKKYAALIYHSGHFFQWAVQEVDTLSSASGSEIFQENLRFFRIKESVRGMEILGKTLLFGGFFVTIISQIYIIGLAFKLRFSAGLFCLLVTPIYAFVSNLRKDDKVRIALKVWAASLVALVFGVFILTGV